MPGRTWLFVSLLLLAALAAGCEDADRETSDASPTAPAVSPTVQEEDTATPAATTATPTTALDIRGEDLSQQPGVRDFLSTQGGELLPEETFYADLTGDGREEAVVHISSGGTLGNLAVFVFGYVEGELRQLLRVTGTEESLGGHVRASLASSTSQLVVQSWIYGPNDANCCPSGGLRTRYFIWDGQGLVVEREVVLSPDEAP